MRAPLDYAANEAVNEGEALGVEAGDITYAALLDRHAAEEPITDEMIRRACLRMETAQSWPFSATPTAAVDDSDAPAESSGGTLARLFRARR